LALRKQLLQLKLGTKTDIKETIQQNPYSANRRKKREKKQKASRHSKKRSGTLCKIRPH